jgi:hypothetical protein
MLGQGHLMKGRKGVSWVGEMEKTSSTQTSWIHDWVLTFFPAFKLEGR